MKKFKIQKTSPDTWRERYDIAVSNQEQMFSRFAYWYRLMYATVTDENMAQWRSKVFIPVLSAKAWSLISKFIGLKPGFEVAVRDWQAASDTTKMKAEQMQKKLEYDYDNPNLDESIRDKMLSPLIDAVVTGTGLAKVPWRVKTDNKYERIVADDGTIDLSKEKVTKSVYGCNDLIPVNIFNVFVAPGASNLYKAPWLIIKEYKTINELKSMNNGAVELYKNLDKLEGGTASADQFAQYKKSRNRLTNAQDPIVEDKTLDHVAVYECYEGDMIYTFADSGSADTNAGGWVELRAHKNPYWHGKYPLVKFAVKQRPFDFWGEGIFEVTERLQSALNDTFNHYMDNWNLSVDGMFIVDDTSNVDDIITQPGAVIRYSGTPPAQFKVPEPNPAAVAQVSQTIEKAIEDATISSYATGLPSSATDKTSGTATGIRRLQEAAGDIISFMRSNFQQSIHQIGSMWLSNNQQYMDKNLVVSDKGKPYTIMPGMLQGDMELRIDDASMEPTSKEDQKVAYLEFINQMLRLQEASVQQHQIAGTQPLLLEYDELAEDLAEKFGLKSIDSVIVDSEEVEQMMKERSQAQGQAPQPEPEKVPYKDAPEDVKRQMEERAGLQPSQQVSPAGTDQQKTLIDAKKVETEIEATTGMPIPDEGMGEEMMPEEEMPMEIPPQQLGEGMDMGEMGMEMPPEQPVDVGVMQPEPQPMELEEGEMMQ